nr:hypothetical protein CFP56_60286 [Quercus suber]
MFTNHRASTEGAGSGNMDLAWMSILIARDMNAAGRGTYRNLRYGMQVSINAITRRSRSTGQTSDLGRAVKWEETKKGLRPCSRSPTRAKSPRQIVPLCCLSLSGMIAHTVDVGKIHSDGPVAYAPRPFDPTLLAQKLEAHKQRMEAQRRVRDQKKVMSNGKTEDSAKPNISSNGASRLSVSKTGSQPSKSRFARHTAKESNETKPRLKPARLPAAPSHIASPHGETASAMANRPTFVSSVRHLQSHPKNEVASNVPPQQGSHDPSITQLKPESTSASEGLRRGSHDSQLQNQHGTSRGYRPGDAEKRRFADSFSITPEENGSRRTQKPPSKNLHAVKDIPAHHTQRLSGLGNLCIADDVPDSLDPTLALRPKLAPHDRNNWAQASQSGEEFRQHFSLLLHRGSRTERSPPPAGPAASQKQNEKQRQQSAGELPTNLINDAVRLIKQEEKTKRRNSFVEFFRKFEK